MTTPLSTPQPKWIPRLLAAKLLGCSITTVYRYHGRGLIPKKDKNGTYLYDRDEVDRLAAVFRVKGVDSGRKPKDTGELAQRVFQAFEVGLSLPEIVMRFAVTPERVRAWHDEYLGVEKTLTAKEKTELEIKHAELKLKQDRQRLIEEKHLTAQRRRRDPVLARRPDWDDE